jgi:hypothetical protein
MRDATDGYSPRYDRLVADTAIRSIRICRSTGRSNLLVGWRVSFIVDAELRQHQEHACD